MTKVVIRTSKREENRVAVLQPYLPGKNRKVNPEYAKIYGDPRKDANPQWEHGDKVDREIDWEAQ
jgi:hypothetical protein